jgi:flagellum-specific peptidoglycan hydrolase FlgJ
MKKSQIIGIILLAIFISSFGFGALSKTEKSVTDVNKTQTEQSDIESDSTHIDVRQATTKGSIKKTSERKRKQSKTIDLDSLSRNEAFIEKYHDLAVSLSKEYDIPWEAVMAQGILESAAGTSNIAKTKNNFFGIAAYTEDPSQAFSFETAEAGWRGYYENIMNTPTYLKHGVCKGENITNPYTYIETIAAAGYCENPDYVKQVHQIIGEVESYADKRNW